MVTPVTTVTRRDERAGFVSASIHSKPDAGNFSLSLTVSKNRVPAIHYDPNQQQRGPRVGPTFSPPADRCQLEAEVRREQIDVLQRQ
jgi:hypothetical protein